MEETFTSNPSTSVNSPIKTSKFLVNMPKVQAVEERSPKAKTMKSEEPDSIVTRIKELNLVGEKRSDGSMSP